MTAMTATAITVAVLLAAALGLVLVRIVRGPTTLDRIVATDVLLAVTACAIATEAAYTRDATGLPILLGISLLGAVGSVSVARFASLRAPTGTGPPGTAVPDTAPPGTVVPDTAPPGTVVPDTAPPGTAVPDTAPPGAVVPGTAPTDTHPTDTHSHGAGPGWQRATRPADGPPADGERP